MCTDHYQNSGSASFVPGWEHTRPYCGDTWAVRVIHGASHRAHLHCLSTHAVMCTDHYQNSGSASFVPSWGAHAPIIAFLTLGPYVDEYRHYCRKDKTCPHKLGRHCDLVSAPREDVTQVGGSHDERQIHLCTKAAADTTSPLTPQEQQNVCGPRHADDLIV